MVTPVIELRNIERAADESDKIVLLIGLFRLIETRKRKWTGIENGVAIGLKKRATDTIARKPARAA